MLEVLQAFIEDRNRGLRDQVLREQGGSKRLGRSYRDWVLHVWDLQGPSDTWTAQLEADYRAQPVFALVGGLGNASWRPIHDFSERFEVPCIFPQTEVPVLAEHDFYTVYLSRGVTLEAQALARFLSDSGESGTVLQVFSRDEASATAADAFRSAWKAAAGAAPVDLPIDEHAEAAYWQQLAEKAVGATLVLWLPPRDLEHAQSLTAAGSRIKAVYLSSSLIASPRTGLAADATGLVRLVYPQDPPALRDARLAVVRRWLGSNGIAPADEQVQMNAYLAATVTGMLVTHSKDTYSREFLLERMEHRLGTALEPSIYPHLSLGPGQRFASKGSYIVAVGGADDRELTPVSDWIVP
jgi:ABC-type branched-subunit amino acid transport system substrate-binding protein